jgi:hypothetical protein
MRRGLVVVVAAAAGAAGCGDSSVSSSGRDESAESQVRDVVLRNIAADAQGNGRAFCSTWTHSYIEQTYGDYRRCVSRFTHPPDRAAHSPRPRFTNILRSSEGHAIAELRIGGGSTQSYTVRPRQRPVADQRSGCRAVVSRAGRAICP